MVPRSRRRFGALIATTAAACLTLSPVGAALADTTTTDDPTLAAAGWLASQFVDDERLEGDFGPDAGLTADAVFALAGAGVASEQLTAASAWLATQVDGYTRGQPFDGPDTVYAGATAKLLLALLVDGHDVTDVGGVDLVAQLQGREARDDADDPGRFTDVSDFGDFSSTLTQSLAVLALATAGGAGPSDASVDFLLAQQCDDGGFRFDPDEAGCTSSTDTTGFAVQALLGHGSTDAVGAAHEAVRWLLDVQGPDGGIEANTNATGLAAVAFALTGAEVAGTADGLEAARSFLLGLQLGCDTDAPGAIAFTADDSGDLARATAQALPGLTGVGLAQASTAGASTAVPSLACDETVAPGDPGDDGGPDDDAGADDDPAPAQPPASDTDAGDGDGTDSGDGDERPVGGEGRDGASTGTATAGDDAAGADEPADRGAEASVDESAAAEQLRPTGVPSGLGGTATSGPAPLGLLVALTAAATLLGSLALGRRLRAGRAVPSGD